MFRKESSDISPDHEERIDDFLARHGGRGNPQAEGTSDDGEAGWFEVYAADGYRLRCEWSRTGEHEEMTFMEIPP